MAVHRADEDMHPQAPLLELVVEAASNKHTPDLLGTSSDGVEPCIAQEATDRVLVDVAVSAEGLHRLHSDLYSRVRRVQNGAGAVPSADLACVARASDGVDVGARGGELGVHVCNLGLHDLELGDALAKLFPLVRVGNGVVARRLHQAQRTARQDESLQVQAGHEHLDTATHLAKHILARHDHVFEDELARLTPSHADLVELLRSAEAWRVPVAANEGVRGWIVES